AIQGAEGIATGTGDAGGPTPAIAVNAGIGTGTGAANDATATATVETNVHPEVATGIGGVVGAFDGFQPDAFEVPAYVAIGVNAGLASGTGAANQPSVAITAS